MGLDSPRKQENFVMNLDGQAHKTKIQINCMWLPFSFGSFFLPTEIIKKQGDEGVPDLVHVMRTLASESIPNLPPGGELASK